MCSTAESSPGDARTTRSQLRTVRVYGNAVRVSISPATTPRARVLVLCNGIGSSLEVLAPLVDQIDPSTEVVRLDLPGVGSSPAPLLPYTFAAAALLLRRLLERLGYRKVDVLGFSWGGALAQQFAWQHPDRCRRLILAATSTGMLSVPGRPSVLTRMLTPRRHRDPSYAARIAGDLYGGSMRSEPGRAGLLLGEPTRSASARGYAYQLGAAFGWSSLPMLRCVRQRTLLLFGDDDPLIPLVNARIFDSLLPRPQLHVFEGGHLDLLTKADELSVVINRFVDAP